MIVSPQFQDKSYVVVGLGKSGLSAAQTLLQSGAQIQAWDDGSLARQEAQDMGIPLTPLDDLRWDEVDYLVLAPGIPLTHPTPHPAVVHAQARHIPIIGDIDLLMMAQPQATFVGITGTNGKSTTTSLTHHLIHGAGIPCAIGGNYGIPALSLPPLGQGGVYVLELSSYQLDLLQTRCLDYGVILNITPDHIDRHGSFDNYVASKKRIFTQGRNGIRVFLNVDDPVCAQIHQDHPESQALSLQDPLDLSPYPRLQGPHNKMNALAAVAIARCLGVSEDALAQGLATFLPPAHRQEFVTHYQNIEFINDSKATNAVATAVALARFDTIFWIVGGKAKEGGLSGLEPYYPQVAHAFLIGDAAESFAQQLGAQVPYTVSHTLETAIDQATRMALTYAPLSSVVLLSPACASFDQFKNFEHRGEAFRQGVAHVINTLERTVS